MKPVGMAFNANERLPRQAEELSRRREAALVQHPCSQGCSLKDGIYLTSFSETDPLAQSSSERESSDRGLKYCACG